MKETAIRCRLYWLTRPKNHDGRLSLCATCASLGRFSVKICDSILVFFVEQLNSVHYESRNVIFGGYRYFQRKYESLHYRPRTPYGAYVIFISNISLIINVQGHYYIYSYYTKIVRVSRTITTIQWINKISLQIKTASTVKCKYTLIFANENEV